MTKSSIDSQIPLVRRVKRPRLSEKQVMHVLLRRYGSLTDFSNVIATYASISRATGIA